MVCSSPTSMKSSSFASRRPTARKGRTNHECTTLLANRLRGGGGAGTPRGRRRLLTARQGGRQVSWKQGRGRPKAREQRPRDVPTLWWAEVGAPARRSQIRAGQ